MGEADYVGWLTTNRAYQSVNLTQPVDATASPFYITNVHNRIIGNAASEVLSGFAFPSLKQPLGAHKSVVHMRLPSRVSLEIDGNAAHSTGWWCYHAAGFYFGGALYTADDEQSLI